MAEPARKNDAIRRFSSKGSLDEQIARLALVQHGVVTLRQLVDLGLTPRAVQHRANAARLHRLYRRTYSLVPQKLLSREGRWMAAVLCCGEDAMLSHRTAALLHEIRFKDRNALDVIIPRRTTRKHAGIQIHTSTTLAASDRTRVRNIPCTSVSRTLLDLSTKVDRRGLERALDQAEVERLLNVNELRDQLARNAHHPGSRLIRGIVEEYYLARTLTRSELEEAFFRICRSARVPDPEVNVMIELNDGEEPILADFVWLAQRVIVETDGYQTHGTRQAFEHNRRRDQRLTMAGWRVVRITWRQVMSRPDQVRRLVQALVLRR